MAIWRETHKTIKSGQSLTSNTTAHYKTIEHEDSHYNFDFLYILVVAVHFDGWTCHCSDRRSYILFVQGARAPFLVQIWWIPLTFMSAARSEQAPGNPSLKTCSAALCTTLPPSALRTRILNNWIYYIIYYYEVLNVVCYGMKNNRQWQSLRRFDWTTINHFQTN
jgi:hypothetical protein